MCMLQVILTSRYGCRGIDLNPVDSSAELRSEMKILAKKLNLKNQTHEHLGNKVELYGPADLEVWFDCKI